LCNDAGVESAADPNDLHPILSQSQLYKKQVLDAVKDFLSGKILNV
jgi:hypothetical protein